jgi:hypothetical protein
VIFDEYWKAEDQELNWENARWTGNAVKKNGSWKLVTTHLSDPMISEGESAAEEETE